MQTGGHAASVFAKSILLRGVQHAPIALTPSAHTACRMEVFLGRDRRIVLVPGAYRNR